MAKAPATQPRACRQVRSVEHLRTRITLRRGARCSQLTTLSADARVDGKLHSSRQRSNSIPQCAPWSRSGAHDKPARPRWDSSAPSAAHHGAADSAPLPVQVFDMPRDAPSFEATRTLDVPGHRWQATIPSRCGVRARAAGSAAVRLRALRQATRLPQPPRTQPPRPRPQPLPHAAPNPTAATTATSGRGRCGPARSRARRSARLRTTGRLGIGGFLGAVGAFATTRTAHRIARADSSQRAIPANARTTHAMGCTCAAASLGRRR